MDQKLILDLKIVGGKLHEMFLEMCALHPDRIDVINKFILKEVMINNYLFSENEQTAFRRQLEAQKIAQNEIKELQSLEETE